LRLFKVFTSGSLFHWTTFSQLQWANSTSGDRELGNRWHTHSRSSETTHTCFSQTQNTHRGL